MRLKKPIIAVTTVAVLALAACGGSGDGGGPTSADDTFDDGGNAGSGMDPNREAPAPPIEGATEGGTLKLVSYAGLNTMDPTEAYYGNTLSILQGLVTRSLTQYAYDEESKAMILVPDLATDLGTPNEDFTEWTFTIREGVRYENGDEVTPEDIKYGIMRSFDRSTFPEGPSYSNSYFLDGDKYKGPYTDGTDYKGVVIDGQDLIIKMARPFPDMPYWGSFPAMGPIPEGKASDPATYRQHPLATGPYKFGDYTPEKALTLVRNTEWDPNTDPARSQYPDEYDMDFDVDTAKIDEIMLQDSGEGQITMTYDNVQAATYLQMKQDAPDRLALGPYPLTNYWGMDYRKIKELEVRQALAWAYPYEAALEAQGELIGVTRIYGSNLLPPGIVGREEFQNPPGHEPGTTDPEKAKELLAEAGYKPGEYEIAWPYAQDDDILVDVKDVQVKALTEAGFKPKPYAATVETLSTVRQDLNAPINVRTTGWISDWPNGSSWLPPVLGSTNLKEEGVAANYSIFSEPSIDQKMDDISTMKLEDQAAAWSDLDKEILTDYQPLFVTSYGAGALAHGSKVQGFFVDETGAMPTWKNLWVEQ